MDLTHFFNWNSDCLFVTYNQEDKLIIRQNEFVKHHTPSSSISSPRSQDSNEYDYQI